MSVQKILVVGGGIAGLTAASALAQKGFQVDLIERKPEISDGGGVGLSLIANATRALAEIDVADACIEAGMGMDTMGVYREDGTLVADMPLPRIGGPDFPGTIGIRRSCLHEALLAAATKAGVNIRCSLTVAHWSESDGIVHTEFSDGSTGDYALMVAAEGISSPTRKRLMSDIEPEFANGVVWRVETPRPSSLTRSQNYVSGRNCVVGIVPLTDETAYMYVGEDTDDFSWRDEETLDKQMLELLEGFGGLVAEMAPYIDSPETVSCRPIQKMLLPTPWHRGRVVMIGDAVHVHAPSLAQGAAMGIEDAIVLADEVSRNSDNLEKALYGFNERRFFRVKAVVDASTALEGAANQDELVRIRQDIYRLLSEPV